MPTNASILKFVRLTHLYLGVLISPAILFFAFTGAVQIFNLHKVSKGGDYKPSKLFVVMAQIHRNQTPIVRPAKVAPEPAVDGKTAATAKSAPDSNLSNSATPSPSAAMPTHNALPLKIFFLLVSISLIGSTFSGIYMTYKYKNNKILVGGLLVAGVVLPVVFTFF
jgi:hypothetical protein